MLKENILSILQEFKNVISRGVSNPNLYAKPYTRRSNWQLPCIINLYTGGLQERLTEFDFWERGRTVNNDLYINYLRIHMNRLKFTYKHTSCVYLSVFLQLSVHAVKKSTQRVSELIIKKWQSLFELIEKLWIKYCKCVTNTDERYSVLLKQVIGGICPSFITASLT